jgi:hypothetical protein
MYHSWLLKRRIAPAWPVRLALLIISAWLRAVHVDVRGRDDTLGDEALNVMELDVDVAGLAGPRRCVCHRISISI